MGLGNDEATFWRLNPYDASTQGGLTFFDTEDCKGRSGLIKWEFESKMITLNDFRFEGDIFFKDSIRSVLIPKDYELEMWSDEQFTTSAGVLSTHRYLNDNDKVACQNIPEGVGSFEIRKVIYEPAAGRWVQSRYNSDISQTLTTGLDMESTDKDRSEVLREIRSSLDAGFTFRNESLSPEF